MLSYPVFQVFSFYHCYFWYSVILYQFYILILLVIFYHFTFSLLSYILVIIFTKWIQKIHQIYYCANGKQYFEKDNFSIQKFFDQLIRCLYLLFFMFHYELSKLFTFACFYAVKTIFFSHEIQVCRSFVRITFARKTFSRTLLARTPFARIMIAWTLITLNALLIWANVFRVKMSEGKNLI